MLIAIVDYGMGNLGSIANMLKKVGAKAVITGEHAKISQADKLILPGVGAFDAGMQHLRGRGLDTLLSHRVLREKVPVLGICLGTQLMTRRSEEGSSPGLGWISADTIRFRVERANLNLRIPHMGWNLVHPARQTSMLTDLGAEPRFYFVHSFHLMCDDPGDVLLTTHYGYEFVSGVQRNHIVGVQFHPEKSHKFGMQLFRNFVAI